MSALPNELGPEPLPRDPIGQRLCLTFPYLWQAIVGMNVPDPSWQTVKPYPLRPRVLWRLWQDSAQLVGVRFAQQTTYALIDIDQGSPYHPANDPIALPKIRAALETIGLYRTILIRSSWSGGLHLYLPLPEVVPTFALASTLKQCLEAQGLAIAHGQLEIFPNCKSYAIKGSYSEYNAHRLPLQPKSGSCLLDADYNPISQDLSRFFEQWDGAAAGQDMRELREAIATAKFNRNGKRHRQTTVVEEWLQDLRSEMEEGWTDYGQTNHLLKTIACYGVVFEGLKGDALTEFVQTTAIQSPGFSQWCRHHADIHLRAAVWARAADGYYWPLGDDRRRTGALHCEEAASVSMNDQRSSDAQSRIRQVMAELEHQGTLPATPTARAKLIASQGGVSLKTLYRYLSLWHPEHTPTPSGERSCKTIEAEPAPAIDSSPVPDLPDPPDPCQNGKFYTFEEDMKGSDPEAGSISQLSVPAPRRLSVMNHRLPDLAPSVDAERLEGNQLPIPHLVPVDEMAQIETDCVVAMIQADRPWVLRRLMALWGQGHQDLVRSLCLWHPEWGFQVNELGVEEVPCP